MGYSFDPKFEQQLDHYLTTPPEPDESDLMCDECQDSFSVGDTYYLIDDQKLCKGCALEWLELQSHEVEYADD